MATLAELRALAAQQYQAGHLGSAEQMCRQMLQADPADVYALHLLGLVAYQAGRTAEAVALLEEAVRQHPELPVLRSSLGVALTAQGRIEEAVGHLQEALRLWPASAEAHTNLGNALRQMGRRQEAEASYRAALRVRPDFPLAHNNLGLVLTEQRRFQDALASIREALRLHPGYAEAHNNLGNTFKQMGRWSEAEASYQQAARFRPDQAQFHNDLGVALAEQRKLAEAEASFRAALRLLPEYKDASYNLAMALASHGRHDEAQDCFVQALGEQRNRAEILNKLGLSLVAQGKPEQALVCYREAASLRPDLPYIASNLLLTLHYPVSYDPTATYAEHLRWASQFVGREAWGVRRKTFTPHAPRLMSHDSGRRLRIGYVSGDFREHVMGRYSEAVIAAHDRSQFEIFCYANVVIEDAWTKRIKSVADHWRSVARMPYALVAEMIQRDQIDVLVDLAGHTGHNCLGVFAQTPAPVQVTHLGYACTTGLAAMDYRLTDAHCDPPGQTEYLHTEKLVRLPRTFWCYVPWASPEVTPLPAQRAGAVAFACVCTLAKVTDAMMVLWAKILAALPQAHMLVVTGAGRTRDEWVRGVFTRQGIGADRLTLAPRQQTEGYLRLFQRVDIGLDVYPFTGCNSTADALWMGVPVISRVGPTAATRQGLSILSQVGLEDLAVTRPEAYVETAVRLAQDLPRLRELRGQLRGRVQRTLGDVGRFTRELEAAYRDIWNKYCATQPIGDTR
jgi:protein O-GlcNAc transferase